MPSISVEASPRKRVLLVEDDAAVRRSLQLLLSSRGFEVRAYASGTGLSQDPEALKSDCLLADLVLPDRDAVTLLNELRAGGWNGPAILMSGHLSEAGKSGALAAGYSAVFLKPFQESVLLSCLVSLTSSRPKPLAD